MHGGGVRRRPLLLSSLILTNRLAIIHLMTNDPLLAQSLDHTGVTRLTPAGRGAVATLSVEGPAALSVVGAFFRPITGQSLDATPIDRIRFGSWFHDNGDQEDVVVCRRGEYVVEIHCHGGDAAAAAIIAALVSRGAVTDDPETWLLRQHRDPLHAAIRLKLAEARTQRTAGILLDQLHGAWPRVLKRIAAHLEIALPDTASADAVTPGNASPDMGSPGRSLAESMQVATDLVQRLINLVPLGRHLTTPWQVVVVGLPNVGKSSLVNTMLGFSRCIVFDQPGTTRDIIVTQTALDGWPVELMDTAGLRRGGDAIEVEGVTRALSRVATADLVVQVSDATRADSQVLDPAVAGHSNVLLVENKSDLVPRSSAAVDVQTSAVAGTGVDRLIELIVSRLIPHPRAPGEAVPIVTSQIALLKELQCRLASGEIGAALKMLSAADSMD